ncbi:hypothetical protein [Gordonia sp. DT101]|uniref:hypothetical protein n=1 Tax=Gordonia sp. DT101 TaxID=3416545 RepID=UPI003CEE14F1
MTSLGHGGACGHRILPGLIKARKENQCPTANPPAIEQGRVALIGVIIGPRRTVDPVPRSVDNA